MTGPDERALLGRLLEPVVGGERAPHCVDALVARFGDVGGAIVAPKDEVARLLNENGEACAARLTDQPASYDRLARADALPERRGASPEDEAPAAAPPPARVSRLRTLCSIAD